MLTKYFHHKTLLLLFKARFRASILLVQICLLNSASGAKDSEAWYAPG